MIGLAGLAGLFIGPVQGQEEFKLGAWSDSPSRIVVYWGDPDSSESDYADAFGASEEYIIRWKQTSGANPWQPGDSKAVVPDKNGRTVNQAEVGGGSAGDPDVIIKLPVSDTSGGGVEYEVQVIRSDASGKSDCLTSSETLDPDKCVSVGTATVTTNTSTTVGGTALSWRDWLLPFAGPRAAPLQQSTDTMYGVDSTSDSTYTVNLSSGAWTLVGSTGTSGPRGLAWDGATMYGVDSTSDSTYTVNLSSGAWTLVGSTGVSGPCGLGWNGSTMYGSDFSSDSTYTVNLNTGAWTEVGGTGTDDPCGLGWNGSTMYGSDFSSDSTYTVNLNTGAWTEVGGTGTSGPNGLGWDGSTMYAVDRVTDSTYTVNLNTGAWTRVGSTGTSSPRGIGYAFSTASTDSSLSALSLNPGTLSPTFATGTTSYTASVANTVTSTTVSATTTDSNATLTGTGSQALSVGANTLNVVVTAEDTTTTTTYAIVVTRASATASITAITARSVGAAKTQVVATLTNPDSTSTTVYYQYREGNSGGWTSATSTNTASTNTSRTIDSLTADTEYQFQASLSSTFSSGNQTVTHTHLGTTLLYFDVGDDHWSQITDITDVAGSHDVVGTTPFAFDDWYGGTEMDGWIYLIDGLDYELWRSRTPLVVDSFTNLGAVTSVNVKVDALAGRNGALYLFSTDYMFVISDPSDPGSGVTRHDLPSAVVAQNGWCVVCGASFFGSNLYFADDVDNSIHRVTSLTNPSTATSLSGPSLTYRTLVNFNGRMLINDEGVADLYEITGYDTSTLTSTKIGDYPGINTNTTTMMSWSGKSAPIISTAASSNVADTTATVTLTATEADSSGRTFNLRYRVGNSGVWTLATAVSSTTTTAAFNLTGLTASSSYNVQGSFDSNYPSDATATASFTTLPSPALSAPTGLTATPTDTSIALTWDSVTNATGYTIQWHGPGGSFSSSNESSSTIAENTITGLTHSTAYEIRVRGTAPGFTGEWAEVTSTTTATANVPSAPGNPTLTVGDGQLGVSWNAPADNGSPISDYDVNYREGSSGGWSDHPHTGTSTSTTITSLTNGQSYQVRVRAVNAIGNSAWSGSSSAEPVGGTTTTPTLTASNLFPTGGETITMTFTPTSTYPIQRFDQWESPNWHEITSSYIGDSTRTVKTGGGNGYITITLGDTSNSPIEHYRVCYRATSGDAWECGSFGDDNYVTVTWSSGALDDPGQVTGVSTTAGATSVALNWTQVSNADEYHVRWKSGAQVFSTDATVRTQVVTSTSVTVSNLVGGSNYDFQVLARRYGANGDGLGVASATETVLTDIPLGTPGNLSALTRTLTTLGLDWDDSTGATGYKVQWRENGGTWSDTRQATTTASFYTISGLESGTAYDVRVRGTGAGITEGDWSTVLETNTLLGEPTGISLSPGATNIIVNWDPVENATGYNVRHRVDGTTDATSVDAGNVTSYTIVSLERSTTYNVRLRADAGSITSGWTNWMSVTTTASTVPGPPTGLSLASGLLKIIATWDAPVDNGGSDISSYNLQYRPTGSQTWTDQAHSSTLTTATISSLTAGHEYEVQVTARNANGEGVYSSIVKATAEGPPDTPSSPGFYIDVSADPDSLDSMEIYWSQPDDNGSGITSYDLQYREVGVASWTAVSDHANTSYTATSLTLHTNYEAQVRATNAHGDSNYSESDTVLFSPQRLFFANDVTGQSGLYWWDEDSAEPVQSGLTGYGNSVTGSGDFAVLNDTLYMLTTSRQLYSLDVGTGMASPVCRVSETNQSVGLASLGDQLYFNAGGHIYTVDPTVTTTCPQTSVGNTGHADITGLASSDGHLYSTTLGNGWPVYRISTADASATLAGNFGAPTGVSYGVAANGYRLLAAGWNTQFAGSLHFLSLRDLSTGQVGYGFFGVSEGYFRPVGAAVLTMTLPSQPGVPSVEIPDDTSLNILWDPPTHTGNSSSLTGYTVEYKKPAESDWTEFTHSTTDTNFSITGLDPGATYEVRVAATNTLGDGPYSPTLTTTTLPSLGMLADLENVSTADITHDRVNLSWDAVTNATSYRIQWRTNSQPAYLTDGTQEATVATNAYSLTGLSAVTQYHIRIRAEAAGYTHSDWNDSTSITTVVIVNQPGGIANLSLVAVYNSITVDWDNVAGATGYLIEWRATATQSTFPVANRATTSGESSSTYEITGLTENVAYEVRVTATKTGADNGTASTRTVTTPLQPPADITGLTLTIVSDTEIRANWDNAERATGYVVQWRESGTANWNNPSQATVANSNRTIRNLTAATYYDVRVKALRTNASDGDFTDGTDSEATHTAAPTGLNLTAGDTEIGVSWMAPANNDLTITGYVVHYRRSNVIEWTDDNHSGTLTTHTIDGLTNDAAYHVRVAAVSNKGVGQFTAHKTRTPVSGPTASSASASGVDYDSAVITVMLDNPRSESVSVYIRYRVGTGAWSTDSSATSGTSHAFALVGLVESSTYNVQVSTDQTFPSGGYQTTSFTTGPLPSVSTISFSDVTNINLDMVVNLTNDYDDNLTVYARNRTPPGSGSWSSQTTVTTTGESVTFSYTNLNGGTEYEFQASLALLTQTNNSITTARQRTDPNPSIDDVSANPVGHTNATINARLRDVSEEPSYIHTVYFQHRTPPGSGSWSSYVSASTTGGTAQRSITGLSPGTFYQVRVSSNNIFTAADTTSIVFRTVYLPAIGVISFTAIEETSTTFVVHVLHPDGTSQTVNASYRTPPNTGTWVSLTPVSTTGRSVEFEITGQTALTQYQVRASLSALYPDDGTVSRNFSTGGTIPDTPFPPATGPEVGIAVRHSSTPYLGGMWVVVGRGASEYGYVANDYGSVLSGELPGQLFADGVGRPLTHLKRHSVADTQWLTIQADFDETSIAHMEGDALRWLRLQIRNYENDVILRANLWDSYSSCTETEICVNIKWEDSEHLLTSLEGEAIAVDFFDGRAEATQASGGGASKIVLMGDVSSGQISCASNQLCYISGTYPNLMMTDQASNEWDGSVAISQTQLTLTASEGNPFIFEAWERYEVHILDVEGNLLVEIPLDTTIDTSAADKQTRDNLVFQYPPDYSPFDSITDYDSEILIIQFVDVGFGNLLERTPGGMIGGQILLTLFAGGLAGFKFKKSRSPSREVIMLSAAMVGAIALPIFGYGSMYWVGGVLVLAVLSMLGIYFMRSRA